MTSANRARAADQRALYAMKSERDWQREVRQIARTYGWLEYCTWDSRHSPSGYPDLSMARPPRIVFAELKSERGKVAPEQEMWAEAMRACPGAEYYLWRPSQIDAVHDVLR